MKKLILSLAIVSIATLSASAQKESSSSTVKVDVGVTGALPIGDLSNTSTFGIGGFVKAAKSFSDNIDGSLIASYTSFLGKTVDGDKFPAQGMFTILAGGSYNMEGGFHIDAGVGFGSESITVDGISASASGVAYRGGIGYRLEGGLDITANYNGLGASGGSISWIGLGISYAILK